MALRVLSLSIASDASLGGGEQQVCDVAADYALGVEDYAKAISLHQEVVRNHPGDAIAHYHPGFAEGMMGNRRAEIREYQFEVPAYEPARINLALLGSQASLPLAGRGH